jgi:hypothetical protein
VCDAGLSRRDGAEDMPASKEYWECARCGLSVHVSNLLNEEARKKARRQYLARLRRRAREGRKAQSLLDAAKGDSLTSDHLALYIAGMALAFAAGTVIAKILSDALGDSVSEKKR